MVGAGSTVPIAVRPPRVTILSCAGEHSHTSLPERGNGRERDAAGCVGQWGRRRRTRQESATVLRRAQPVSPPSEYSWAHRHMSLPPRARGSCRDLLDLENAPGSRHRAKMSTATPRFLGDTENGSRCLSTSHRTGGVEGRPKRPIPIASSSTCACLLFRKAAWGKQRVECRSALIFLADRQEVSSD